MFEFAVQGVHPVPHTLVPMLAFELSITGAGVVRGIALHTQIRIEPTRRSYPPEIRARLFELFGPPTDWGRTVHSLLWTHADAMVPAFEGDTRIELPVACTYDFNVAATRYFAALDSGDIPLEFLFSGTVFFAGSKRTAAGGQGFVGGPGRVWPSGGGLESAHGKILSGREPGLLCTAIWCTGWTVSNASAGF